MALIDDPVAMGLILVTVAGACSPLGAAVVFFIRSCRPSLICMTLGLAAGVMIFVSLTEALAEAVHQFEVAKLPPAAAQAAAYGIFFITFPLAVALDRIVGVCLDVGATGSVGGGSVAGDDNVDAEAGPVSSSSAAAGAAEAAQGVEAGAAPATRPQPQTQPPLSSLSSTTPPPKGWRLSSSSQRWRELLLPSRAPCLPAFRCMSLNPPRDDDAAAQARALKAVAPEDFALVQRVNIMTLVAITVHNIPEGLATFAGFYASPRIGMAIAVAIACHNVPEGIVIGVGILAATGSRLRAVAWASVAGLAEPFGALIAWGIIAGGGAHPAIVGSLLALAAGIMVFIALLELLPSALKFGSYTRTATSTFLGMFVIALSLVLLTLWSPQEPVSVTQQQVGPGVAQLG